MNGVDNTATKRNHPYRVNISPAFCRLNVVVNDPHVLRNTMDDIKVGKSLLPAAVSWDGKNNQHTKFLLIP